MRLIFSLLLALCGVPFIIADLTCLEWTFFSPAAGLFCHFAPSKFSKVENHTVTSVKSAAQEVENLLKFDVKHAPIIVAFEYASTLKNQHSFAPANAQLRDVSAEYLNVTIGFAKESANQVVSLFNVLDWSDVAICQMQSATNVLAISERKKSRRALYQLHPQLGVSQGAEIMNRCVDEKFNKPAVFNFTDSNQKVGATISDISGLFVPIGLEGDAAKAAPDAVELVIPGSEKTARVVKRVGTGSDHFANEEEALKVREKLSDETWTKKHCVFKGWSSVPSLLEETHNVRPRRKRTLSLPEPADRGMSCDVPTVNVEPQESDNILMTATDPEDVDGEYLDADQIGETPKLDIHSFSQPDAILDAATRTSTALIEWSDAVKNAYPGGSMKLMRDLRAIFELHPSPEYVPFDKYVERVGEDRMVLWTHILGDEPEVSGLKKWRDAVATEVRTAGKVLNRMSDAELDNTVSDILIFYSSDEDAARFATLHADRVILVLDWQDAEGLVVYHAPNKMGSYVPVNENSWYLLKGSKWGPEHNAAPKEITHHAVYGGEMLQKGRVSIVAVLNTKA